MNLSTTLAMATLSLLLALPVATRAQELPKYGTDVDLAMAKKIMVAAEAEAKQKGWPVAIAIVDTHGLLLLFQRLDQTQHGSVEVAIEKARTAALFRRESKVFEDMIGQGGANMKVLKLPGALGVEGGLPIIVDGKIVGGIGVSGVKSSEDAEVGRAGLKALSATER
jgi:glc operon protein GlcG